MVDGDPGVPHIHPWPACLRRASRRGQQGSTPATVGSAVGANRQLNTRFPRSPPRRPIGELPLPKLNTGVRSPSPALRETAGQCARKTVRDTWLRCRRAPASLRSPPGATATPSGHWVNTASPRSSGSARPTECSCEAEDATPASSVNGGRETGLGIAGICRQFDVSCHLDDLVARRRRSGAVGRGDGSDPRRGVSCSPDRTP